MQEYGKSLTILTDISRALSSGGSLMGNTIDRMISIPGALLPAGFGNGAEVPTRRLGLRLPAMPPKDWTLFHKTSDT